MEPEKMGDAELVEELARYGFTFLGGTGAIQRVMKAPAMVLSTPSGNTPLVKLFTLEFRYESPRRADPVAAARDEGMNRPESLWVDLQYDLYLDEFEVSPSVVKQSPKGVPIPAYRANTLFNTDRKLILQTSDEIIENRGAYDRLASYKQKEFDPDIVGSLMAERIRRFLKRRNVQLSADKLRDRGSHEHLRHFLKDDQKDFILKQVNDYLAGKRGQIGHPENAPHGEETHDIPPQVGEDPDIVA